MATRRAPPKKRARVESDESDDGMDFDPVRDALDTLEHTVHLAVVAFRQAVEDGTRVPCKVEKTGEGPYAHHMYTVVIPWLTVPALERLMNVWRPVLSQDYLIDQMTREFGTEVYAENLPKGTTKQGTNHLQAVRFMLNGQDDWIEARGV